jgi:hypothetical protein
MTGTLNTSPEVNCRPKLDFVISQFGNFVIYPAAVLKLQNYQITKLVFPRRTWLSKVIAGFARWRWNTT